jgi:hypothetical protein
LLLLFMLFFNRVSRMNGSAMYFALVGLRPWSFERAGSKLF